MRGAHSGGVNRFHYEDRALPGIESIGKLGSWTAEEAVNLLRIELGTGGMVKSAVDREDVVTWIRRDLDGELAPSWKVEPNDLYDRVAATGQGEEMFRWAGALSTPSDMANWPTTSMPGSLNVSWASVARGWCVCLRSGSGCSTSGVGPAWILRIALDAVGPTGTAFGIDCRSQLLAPAASLLTKGSFALAEASACPVPSAWATTVVANGLPPLLRIDLAGHVITEAARVLAPGGWLQATVLVTGADRPVDQVSDLEIVNAWRFGKPLCSQYRLLLAEAGFEPISLALAPSPFIPGFRAGSVNAAVVGARRR